MAVNTENALESRGIAVNPVNTLRFRLEKTINHNAPNTSFIYDLYVIGDSSPQVGNRLGSFINRRNKEYH